MGGRAAEELFFSNSSVTTGCGSDLRSATYTAYQMLLFNAMGKQLITTDFDQISEKKKEEIELEVQGLLDVISKDELQKGAKAASR